MGRFDSQATYAQDLFHAGDAGPHAIDAAPQARQDDTGAQVSSSSSMGYTEQQRQAQPQQMPSHNTLRPNHSGNSDAGFDRQHGVIRLRVQSGSIPLHWEEQAQPSAAVMLNSKGGVAGSVVGDDCSSDTDMADLEDRSMSFGAADQGRAISAGPQAAGRQQQATLPKASQDPFPAQADATKQPISATKSAIWESATGRSHQAAMAQKDSSGSQSTSGELASTDSDESVGLTAAAAVTTADASGSAQPPHRDNNVGPLKLRVLTSHDLMAVRQKFMQHHAAADSPSSVTTGFGDSSTFARQGRALGHAGRKRPAASGGLMQMAAKRLARGDRTGVATATTAQGSGNADAAAAMASSLTGGGSVPTAAAIGTSAVGSLSTAAADSPMGNGPLTTGTGTGHAALPTALGSILDSNAAGLQAAAKNVSVTAENNDIQQTDSPKYSLRKRKAKELFSDFYFYYDAAGMSDL